MNPPTQRSSYGRDVSRQLDGTDELPQGRVPTVGGGAILAVAVVLTALNLRPAVTSIAPLLGDMRADLGTSATWAGLLTTLPTLCFAGAGLAAPAVSARIGTSRTISLGLLVLAVGLGVRSLDGPYVVLGATLLACAGIALINVLIPVVIKGSFPARVGLMTGIYTAALQGGGALGSAITPGVEQWFGNWRTALAFWSLVALAALAVWIPASMRHGEPAQVTTAVGAEPRPSMLRSALAWQVTLFLGAQGFLAYIVMGWLPQVFIDSGVSKVHAGMLVGLVSLVGVPVALVLLPLAARQDSQSAWIVGIGLFGMAGIVGVLLAPAAQPVLWSLLIGVGMGVFSMALAVIALRSRDAEDTARLSAMAQGVGYLIAGLGPFLFGLLHDVSSGWTVPWIMLLVVYALQIVVGALAGRDRVV